jgi:hypothetical protein
MCSAPFFSGIFEPTMVQHNPYVLIFGVFTLPVMYVFHEVSVWIAEYLWDVPTPERTQLVGISIAGLFWCCVGSAIGQYKDIREGRVA